MIKAIVFDIGGVLDKGHVKNYYQEMCRELGIDKKRFDKAYWKYGKKAVVGKLSGKEFVLKVARELGINSEIMTKSWVEHKREDLFLDKKVESVIKKLKKNYIVATLTNVTSLNQKLREEKGFYNLFSVKVCSCIDGVCKPHVNAYKLMIKKIKIKPDEAVFIDDNPKCLIPAKKLGMKVILFKSATQLKKNLKKLGVKL